MLIVDTNFLMDDYKNLELLNDDVMIPITVIHELDKHKKDRGATGYNTRKSLRLINDAIDNGSVLPNGKKLQIDPCEYDDIEKNDHKIIESALCRDHIDQLATNDVGMKIVAMTKGVSVRKFADSKDKILNPGLIEEQMIEIDLLQEMFQTGSFNYKEIDSKRKHPNSCFLFTDGVSGSALARRIGDEFVKITPPKDVYGKITGKNMGQRFYLDMLMDKRIKVVLVNGVAGSGKTLLALAAGLHMQKKKKFENVICAKSVEEVGKDIGYRPGDEEDKLKPYYAAFGDNLDFLSTEEGSTGKLIKDISDKVYYEHIGYMRGRTFRDSFIIIDECQNLSQKDIKTVISRAGENSKIVCCGDLHQIDNGESKYTNGLFHAQRKLFGNEIVGTVSLEKSERSEIAELSALL